MNVWYLTSDLMFSSRVVAQAERAGHTVLVIASPVMLGDRLKLAANEPSCLVILDLTTPGLNITELVTQIRLASPAAKIIAYGPHVYAELLATAQSAGCDAVMSNGQFNSTLSNLLAT